jgi:hypothetical protein
MPDAANVFCHWSAEFSVTYDRPEQLNQPGTLRFIPLRRGNKAVHKEWFENWYSQSLGGKPLPQLLNALLPLAALPSNFFESEAAISQILDVAQQLGPLFTALPWHGLTQNTFYKEPMQSWYLAAQKLAALGHDLGRLTTISKDGSSTARRRRALRVAEADYGADYLESVGDSRRRELIAPIVDSVGVSPSDKLEGRIADIMDTLWIIPIRNAEESDWRLALPRLRLSADHTLQLNLPFGIQALLVMMIHDQRLGRSVQLRTCKREACRVPMFMQPRQQYCSAVCQNLEAVRRHRARTKSKSRVAKVSHNA